MAHKFIEHLIEDHEKQRKLGKQLREAKTAEERKRLLDEFRKELLPHMEGEEASIFDFMKAEGGEPKKGAMEAIQEHHVAKLVLRELEDLSLDGDTFRAKAYVLDELNEHHMQEEEKEHFPQVERMTSPQQLSELYQQYEEKEKAVKSQL